MGKNRGEGNSQFYALMTGGGRGGGTKRRRRGEKGTRFTSQKKCWGKKNPSVKLCVPKNEKKHHF